jgi:hypothetical protein
MGHSPSYRRPITPDAHILGAQHSPLSHFCSLHMLYALHVLLVLRYFVQDVGGVEKMFGGEQGSEVRVVFHSLESKLN